MWGLGRDPIEERAVREAGGAPPVDLGGGAQPHAVEHAARAALQRDERGGGSDGGQMVAVVGCVRGVTQVTCRLTSSTSEYTCMSRSCKVPSLSAWIEGMEVGKD